MFKENTIDECVVGHLKEHDGKKLVSVMREGLKLDNETDEKTKTEEKTKSCENLYKIIKDILGDKVEKVVIYVRIVDFLCYWTTRIYGGTAYMESIMKARAFREKSISSYMSNKISMDVYPNNGLMDMLMEDRVDKNATNKSGILAFEREIVEESKMKEENLVVVSDPYGFTLLVMDRKSDGIVVCFSEIDALLLIEATNELAFCEIGPLITLLQAILQFDVKLLFLVSVDRICKDGVNFNNILAKGEKWKNLKVLGKVLAKSEAEVEDGTTISKSEEVEFTVHDGYAHSASLVIENVINAIKHTDGVG